MEEERLQAGDLKPKGFVLSTGEEKKRSEYHLLKGGEDNTEESPE